MNSYHNDEGHAVSWELIRDTIAMPLDERIHGKFHPRFYRNNYDALLPSITSNLSLVLG